MILGECASLYSDNIVSLTLTGREEFGGTLKIPCFRRVKSCATIWEGSKSASPRAPKATLWVLWTNSRLGLLRADVAQTAKYFMSRALRHVDSYAAAGSGRDKRNLYLMIT